VLRLAGAATRLRAAMGASRRPREDRRFQQAFNGSLARLRPATGQAAWESGQSLTRAATLDLARELLTFGEPAERTASPVGTASHGLTPRELEIAARLAGGLTNRAIARELLITDGTVRAHVEHILGKLGVRSRAEVAARLSAFDTPPAQHPILSLT
jgi:DNA-binding NarL/FixJ family response regulator